MAPFQKLSTLPCGVLKGVGPQIVKRLAKLNIHSVQDLLFHLPLRYQDRTKVTPIAEAMIGDYCVIEGVVANNMLRRQKQTTWLCQIKDDSADLILRFFHFSPGQMQAFAVGSRLRCFGEIRYGRDGGFEMIHPECKKLTLNKIPELTEYLTPIYPSTEGISQYQWRSFTEQALQMIKNDPTLLPELLPPQFSAQFAGFSFPAALAFIHRPGQDSDLVSLASNIHPAQRRLAFEELLAHQLTLQRLRLAWQAIKAPSLILNTLFTHLSDSFKTNLPFHLTNAQTRVLQDITDDLAKSSPMLRLVQGDVGSGKTVVAALAALLAVSNDYQAVLMAPTELLAEQHFQNFQRWCAPLNISITLLVGKIKGTARQEALAALASGQAQIIIGTHALFQETVSFKRLGLVIIDEQHRFGVEQRLALCAKGQIANTSPHQLIMTATPIPRTLAMTVHADLDCSIIDELPPGRIPPRTVAIANNRRDDVIERVAFACQNQRQVYWVCTLISETETRERQAAEATVAMLQDALPNTRIALIHGKQKAAEKDQIMCAFKKGEIQILVATTVIEVGVDVPNASVMIIENAERLGLSQLHQLRGRVGRGQADSYCVLLYQPPLAPESRARLQILRETQDGFKIAEADLALRGMGEVLGVRQTGLVNFHFADLVRDEDLLALVQATAKNLINADADLLDGLIQRWVGDTGVLVQV